MPQIQHEKYHMFMWAQEVICKLKNVCQEVIRRCSWSQFLPLVGRDRSGISYMGKTWPPQIPEIPEELQNAANEANLIVFVGAGVSRLMGCPSWNELAIDALKQLATQDLMTYGDIQQLATLDPKKRLSIALQVSEANSAPLDFTKLLQPKRSSNSRIYEYLKKIGCVYVTTNYDRYLDVMLDKPQAGKPETEGEEFSKEEPELICWPHQLKGLRLRKPGTVIHLHGSIEKHESMIISTSQYLRHYDDEQVQAFLRELFNRYTVLFVGYNMEEWEVLEHILRKGVHQTDNQKNIFMLTGFYSHQEKTFIHLRDYYRNSFGVWLIPFSLDFLEHDQLERILEDWSSNLEIGDPLLADDLVYVLEVADE